MENFNNFNTPPPPPQTEMNMMPPRKLPNSTGVLVLGIVSIVGCCCYGIVGLVCGIIAIVLASKDSKLYNLNPSAYTPSSYSNIKTGRILGIIGICLSILYIIYVIILMVTIGLENLNNPDELRRIIEEWETTAAN